MLTMMIYLFIYVDDDADDADDADDDDDDDDD